MDFGEKLRTARKAKNITQEQLAELLGVTRQAVSKWEADGGYPETEKLILLAQTLGVSLDDLLGLPTNAASTANAAPAEPTPNTPAPAAPAATILIAAYDEKNIANCQAVKASPVAGGGKAPKFALLGIESTDFWGEHSKILGWYATAEAIQAEITAIHCALRQGEPEYRLQYFAKVEERGLLSVPRLVE